MCLGPATSCKFTAATFRMCVLYALVDNEVTPLVIAEENEDEGE